MNENLRNFETALIDIVQQDVVPALGCTEPISLALASATAAHYLGLYPEKIVAKVSPNLMKNGLGVAVPGTGMVGLPIAAAVGALGGDASGGLEVLKKITPEQVEQAKQLLQQHKVKVSIKQTDQILYAESTIYAGEDWVRVVIQGQHTNIILIEKNGDVLFKAEESQAQQIDPYAMFNQLKAKDIFDFATQIELEKIKFILQPEKLNAALSAEGLRNDYGLHIGRTLQKHIGDGLMSDDLLSRIMINTTAASDARMGGATLPAMSNSGSGNQGITATMPVVVVADHIQADEEKRIRALFLSHLMAIFIHSKLPKLSALCAVTTAAMGSCAGISYLLTNKFDTAAMAISSMIGDISGMICDGAANSCAMKVSTSVTSAYKSVLMAMNQTGVTGNEGIVDHCVDQSIDNLCAIACKSMQHTDVQIIEIMANKPQD
ncbi:L-cysteine desulfidase family protein [Avibacterium paragallinarum]|uniref:L-cysteine desulfidase family protein n=1 Tax=Avibacterium paragallinarum TaxID=728 RepID=UPI0014529B7B|nr:L-serine ammonia-lyase, iron-sulfur-dependent, subunit alpha [Avibacterium paragallinarum]QJE09658.1 serine dehydratase subunit alpha family protein [Avibacterium paragallinarum]QJE11854.1 serine dehydratase subunit alpha family protein [Avibacterium paragallinarum]QJE14053.1 serine dehydratase subunit alpha family protein [Avibacterium paragallinarum]QJE16255.1 serine dehydratase subunit alpha family protein [Avibacterium paragallinarum]QJE18450.1 serine dehydratase subunit alpha family pr